MGDRRGCPYVVGRTMKEILRTIKIEGDYVNDPHDSGGETKYGISKKSYPQIDIKNLSIDAAIEIYKRDFFYRLHLDQIASIRVRWKVFDIAVNQGPGTAARHLQKIVGAKVDGKIGPETIEKSNAIDEKELLWKLMQEQIFRYVEIVSAQTIQLIFLKGWIRRAFDLGEGLEQD
jgi:lysozyme family protein